MFTRIFYKHLTGMFGFANNKEFTVKNYKGQSRVHTDLRKYAIDFYSSLGSVLKQDKTAEYMSGGVAFGDGDTPPTLDDYCLSGNHIINHNTTVLGEINDNFDTATVTYTVTNTGDSSFTIKEVGVYVTAGGQTHNTALVWREVLSEPVTIEAGGVGQVTLTFKVNAPEA
jgi:hypothetical protein